MSPRQSPDPKTLELLRDARESFPVLAERIDRALLIALHQRGHASIDEIHAEARRRAESGVREEGTPQPEDNAPLVRRLDAEERRLVKEITAELAATLLEREEVEDLINLTRKREEARTLEEIANLSSVSFGLLADKVRDFADLPRGQTLIPESEAVAVRVALIRHFISDQLEFIGIAREHLTIRDFAELLPHVIGDERGVGRVGGKAAGLFLAHRILRRAQEEDPDAPQIPVEMPESWYLRSDVIERFLEHEGLYELQSQKYKPIEEIRNEYPLILKVFKNAEFPPDVVERLRGLLEEIGEHPLIVRSSSLLEDRFGAAFAGKYRSLFLANQGSIEERLTELLGAIAEVYASTLAPDPISYRRKHNLLDYSENMAVLIQKVVGRRYGEWFLPVWAGVAFSRNEFRRNPRIRPEDGIARVVLGLGTRAVDRVSTDFPRMIALGAPTLRPEVTVRDVIRRSQSEVDAIHLGRRRFETAALRALLDEEPMPGLEEVVSIQQDGFLRRPVGLLFSAEPEDMVVTFERFAGESAWPNFLRWALRTLERAYGHPVDIEFAFDGERFHLLQCRPQVVRGARAPVEVPSAVPASRQLFSASRDIGSAVVSGVEYVVLVDAAAYDKLPSEADKREVAKIVSRLNQRLADRSFILMGPGRWGSKDPKMGVSATYADLDNTRMLIEVARPLGGYVPEASFGSHFFQDLVESDIAYLALYPDEEENVFNESFLLGAANELPRMLPDAERFADALRVIHVPSASGGLFLRVVMDGEADEALGYLAAR